ncbi:hypothetical protein O6H91_14G080700 [Diphasiastrum complanatum]|uniref:Uncharacterized protein n=1 Tax=Diphasiastrum complanatum TaxID=34168 RepID=A0ACC2BRF0_DIPCM|nr:hypothetical protein O6H91_14G080700 [Diphasiastrum complanatum]
MNLNVNGRAIGCQSFEIDFVVASNFWRVGNLFLRPYTKAKTGSVCCVAARPHGATDSHCAWATSRREHGWHFNEKFSPSLLVNRNTESHSTDLAGMADEFQFGRRSMSSSNKGSAHGIGRESYRRNSLASSKEHVNEFISAVPPDSMSSLADTKDSLKEVWCSESIEPRFSNSLCSIAGEGLRSPTARVSPKLHLFKSPSLSSKSLRLAGSQKLSWSPSDGRVHSARFNKSKARLSESRYSLQQSAHVEADFTSDQWSVPAFSELIASTYQGYRRPIDARSLVKLGFISAHNRVDKDALGLETIKAYCSPLAPRSQNEVCGLCSRFLSRPSYPNSQKLLDNNHLTVVGVLSCGHTFHADCLEQVTPEAELNNPSCPHCRSAERMTKCYTNDVKLAVNKSSLKGGHSTKRHDLSLVPTVATRGSLPGSGLSAKPCHTGITSDFSSHSKNNETGSRSRIVLPERNLLSKSVSQKASFQGARPKNVKYALEVSGYPQLSSDEILIRKFSCDGVSIQGRSKSLTR